MGHTSKLLPRRCRVSVRGRMKVLEAPQISKWIQKGYGSRTRSSTSVTNRLITKNCQLLQRLRLQHQSKKLLLLLPSKKLLLLLPSKKLLLPPKKLLLPPTRLLLPKKLLRQNQKLLVAAMLAVARAMVRMAAAVLCFRAPKPLIERHQQINGLNASEP